VRRCVRCALGHPAVAVLHPWWRCRAVQLWACTAAGCCYEGCVVVGSRAQQCACPPGQRVAPVEIVGSCRW
jgi:hypothetical protein